MSRSQLAILMGIALIVAFKIIATQGSRRETGIAASQIRSSPLSIAPIPSQAFDDAWGDDIADKDVITCFRRLLPSDTLSRSGTLHALRLWRGTHATAGWSSELALARLLNTADDNHWIEPMVNGYGAFFLTSADELARRAVGAENLDPHRNKTLSVLALCGVDASTKLRVANSSYTVRDLIRGAMNESRTQHGSELPWTIVGLASYVASDSPWSNRHGERVSLESLIQALLESSQASAPCLGAHVPYAATFVLRSHQQTPLLTPTGEALVRANLQRMIDSLRLHQRPSGSWGKDWSAELAGIPGVVDAPVEVLVTGHHLEWLSLLPPELAPPPEMIRRAARYLISAILNAPKSDITKNYSAYSHAGCALRNVFPLAWQSTQDDLRKHSHL